MSYADYLASRGYHRVTIERTSKQPGDMVLNSSRAPAERIAPAPNVVAMRRSAKAEARRG